MMAQILHRGSGYLSSCSLGNTLETEALKSTSSLSFVHSKVGQVTERLGASNFSSLSIDDHLCPANLLEIIQLNCNSGCASTI